MFSSETLVSRFHEYGRVNRLFGKRDAVIIVAVSGGVDSMVLFDLLSRERDIKFMAAHFNHRLRDEESDGDEEFVRSFCRQRGIECHVGNADTARVAAEERRGIQESARDLRYAFFRSVAQQYAGSVIATGHHADDNAETILLHLCRGTGLDGMRGILPTSENEGVTLIRPLLFARRNEIEEYARHEKLVFRIDSSNLKDDYARNALRHRAFPMLEEIFGPSVVDTVSRTAEAIGPAAEFLSAETERALFACRSVQPNGTWELSIAGLNRLHPALRALCLREAAVRAGSAPGMAHVMDLGRLLASEPGTRVSLPGGIEAWRKRATIRFAPMETPEPFAIAVEPGRTYTVAGFRFSSEVAPIPAVISGKDPSIEFVDVARIEKHRLELRSWQPGDAFVPLGMSGTKKLSDFFVDEKVPIERKRRTPVLATEDGNIVWVCGLRIDDRFKITGATTRALRLELTPLSER
jgi:tRNA(Ile)-lysidine synthase